MEILQVAMPSSRGSCQPRDQTQVSCIAGRFFTVRTMLFASCPLGLSLNIVSSESTHLSFILPFYSLLLHCILFHKSCFFLFVCLLSFGCLFVCCLMSLLDCKLHEGRTPPLYHQTTTMVRSTRDAEDIQKMS